MLGQKNFKGVMADLNAPFMHLNCCAKGNFLAPKMQISETSRNLKKLKNKVGGQMSTHDTVEI